MGNRQEAPADQRAFALTLVSSLLAAVFCALQLLRIPADSKNAFFLGLSKERLLMLAGFAFIMFILAGCLVFRDRVLGLFSRKPGLKQVFPPAAVLSLFFLLLPEYRFGRAAAVFVRLRPYLLCFFLISAFFSLCFRFIDGRFSALRETFRSLWEQKRFILPALGILLAGVAFTELTGTGKTPETSLWNKNGIPLQSIQLFCVTVVFFCLRRCSLFSADRKRKTVSEFFLIWAVSALVWSLAPGMHHFFAPGPYEPNLTYYPYSDAANYDLSAQTALNGWGFNFGRTLLKPSVVLVSFLSRLIAENDTTKSMLIQSALYAVLPAIIYLFGNAIGGPACGYPAAVFSLLKEWNALRTRSVSTVHSRLVMSEFLTQILLALFCYAVFRLLQKRGRGILYAILAGGAFTIGILTRYNFFAFLPAAFVILAIGYRREFRKLAKIGVFFCLSVLLTAAPFCFRERNLSWNIFSEITYTVKYVLIRQRINGKDPMSEEEFRELLKSLGRSGNDEGEKTEGIRTVTERTAGDAAVTELPAADAAAERKTDGRSEKTAQAPTAEITAADPVPEKDGFNTGQITQEISNNSSEIKPPFFRSMMNHGMHNLISSFLTLPLEWRFDDLPHLYTQEGDGLWRDDWQGSFSFRQWAAIGIWILLGAAALGILIREHGIAGFSILYFWIVYAFSIGFSRSSGGRYIVPINWVPMLLLGFLLSLAFSRGKLRLPEPECGTLPAWQPVLALAGFTAFFSLMVLFEAVIPARNNAAPEGDLALLRERLSDREEIDWDLAESQIASGVMHVSHGTAVYPRFYYFRKGEHSAGGAFMEKEFSRMTFVGLDQNENGSFSSEYLMPHKELIGDFPQDSVYRALSCSSSYGYEDVLAVTVETPDGEIFTYVRDPLPGFYCPVPEPVCPSAENCF